jgi:hypothetical protein
LLTIGSDGLTVNSGAAANVLNTNVAVGSAQTWMNAASAAASLSFGGTISGSSALTLAGSSTVLSPTGSFVFSGANSYSGALTLLNGNATLTLNGNGTLKNISGVGLGSGTSLILDDSTAPISRLGSAINVTSKGGTLTIIGNSTATTSESIGTLRACY